MKRRLSATAVALVLALVLAGCSNEDTDETPLTELADAATMIWCAKVFDCCTDEELQNYSFADEPQCRTKVSPAIDQYMVKPMQAAIASGRGEYDGKKALACLESFQALGCVGTNDPQDFLKNCSSPWTAKQTAGQDCDSLFECVTGTYCSQETSQCVTPAGENQACTPDQDPYCEVELYCDGTNCVARKPETSACSDDIECAVGTECTQGTCTPIEPSCTGRP